MVQRDMMERRLEREVERSKSVLYKTKGVVRGGFLAEEDEEGRGMNGGGGFGSSRSRAGSKVTNGYVARGGPTMDEKDRLEIEQALSPEQLQLFAQENNELLKQYEDTLDQVR